MGLRTSASRDAIGVIRFLDDTTTTNSISSCQLAVAQSGLVRRDATHQISCPNRFSQSHTRVPPILRAPDSKCTGLVGGVNQFIAFVSLEIGIMGVAW